MINSDLISQNFKRKREGKKYFFSISKDICGESHVSKINKVLNSSKIKGWINFCSAPENVAWLLNIRGHDNPNSPIPNCHLLLDDQRKIYLIADKAKTKKLIFEKNYLKNK